MNRARPAERFDTDTEVQVEGGSSLIVQQQRGKEDDGESQATVFDGARVLCSTLGTLLRNALNVDSFFHHPIGTVLDLGASTGILGLACALSQPVGCQHAIITDLPPLVQLMQSNIDRNRGDLRGYASAAPLVWGETTLPQSPCGQADVVLLCECAYAIQEHENLVRTTAALLKPCGVAIAVTEYRGDVNRFFAEEAAKRFEIRHAAQGELSEEAQKHMSTTEFLVMSHR